MIDRVDAHHHLWTVEPVVPDWLIGEEMTPIRRSFTTEDLSDAVAGTGVRATVLVQTVHEVLETEEFLGVADLTPLIGAVTGWVDLTDEGVRDELARLRDLPGGSYLRAIRHGAQSEPDDRWLARPEVIDGVRAVGAAGLVYELLTIPSQLPAAVELVSALPEVSFVLDHASKPFIATDGWQPWADDLASPRRAPQRGLQALRDWSPRTPPPGRPSTCAVTWTISWPSSVRPGCCSARTGRSASCERTTPAG